MKTLLIILLLLPFGLKAQDTTLKPTDTLFLKPTRAQIAEVVSSINEALRLSTEAKTQSERATITVHLLRALEALDRVKIEEQKAKSEGK